MRVRTLIAGLLGLLLLSGCGLFADDPPRPAATYEGTYRSGFEVNSFAPCGRDETWWVGGEAAAELINQYQSVTEETYTPVYVRLVGTPSSKGEYGHMGSYDRAFTVDTVLTVRPQEPDDCS